MSKTIGTYIMAVPNRGKLLLDEIKINGAIIWPNTDRIQIVTVMQCLHFVNNYMYSFKFTVIVITNDYEAYSCTKFPLITKSSATTEGMHATVC